MCICSVLLSMHNHIFKVNMTHLVKQYTHCHRGMQSFITFIFRPRYTVSACVHFMYVNEVIYDHVKVLFNTNVTIHAFEWSIRRQTASLSNKKQTTQAVVSMRFRHFAHTHHT